ncbi:MAG: hypothetical protein CVU00_03860 [Bacteroidetes bacterium HGW-Bacteroidetes-17]|nr:MAG: hypothetical protein CVU00_03860 [Bacteroidetes bacterium HGW-Bacteroidetes-17]
MSKDYSSDIPYEINFVNPPSDQIITKAFDSIVYLKIDSRGFDLLTEIYFKKKKQLLIDLHNVRIYNTSSSFRSYILSASLLNQIRNQNGFQYSISKISPDTLYLNLEKTMSKEVEVLLKIDIIPKQQHYVYGKITPSIQKITISGPPSLIDSINSISTEYVKLVNVQSNQFIGLKLINPYKDAQLHLSTDSVQVHIPIEQFTESSLIIPIKIFEKNDLRIKLFPETVTVKFLVALKDFDRITPDIFSAVIHYDEHSLNSQIIVLERYPAFIKIIDFQPKSVEYLILVNND